MRAVAGLAVIAAVLSSLALAIAAVLSNLALAIGTPAAPATSATSGARAVTRCSGYPHPGSTIAGQAPARLRAQYGVLRRAQRPGDRIAVSRLGSLSESEILTGSIRHLGNVADGGRVYLVAARHLLPSPLDPVRCVAPEQRPLQRALLPELRREYSHRGLCLVIVYPTRTAPTCDAAPGTVAPFLVGSGVPGLGLAPDGVAAVLVRFRAGAHAPLRAAVHDNFWRVDDSRLRVAPCGLDWIDAQAVVLRQVTTCVADTT